MQKGALSLAILFLILLGVFAAYLSWKNGEEQKSISVDSQPNGSQAVDSSDITQRVTFNCGDDKTIQAHFINGGVELALSDGRNLRIPLTASISGALYTNTDESIVFWNKSDTAVIIEGDVTTYTDCVTVPPNIIVESLL